MVEKMRRETHRETGPPGQNKGWGKKKEGKLRSRISAETEKVPTKTVTTHCFQGFACLYFC